MADQHFVRAVLILAFLAGCSYQPDDSQSIKLTLVASSSEIAKHCGKDNTLMEGFGCAKQNRSEINPGGACEIVAVRPRAFDDHEAIKTLGHELWHCFTGPVHK